MWVLGTAGVPDRLIVFPGGRIGFAEMKRPGGKVSTIQVAQIRFLKEFGFLAEVIWNEEQIDKFLEKILGGG